MYGYIFSLKQKIGCQGEREREISYTQLKKSVK